MYTVKDESFKSKDYKFEAIPALWIIGKQDLFYQEPKIHDTVAFPKAIVVEHEDGHQFPKVFTPEFMKTFSEFLDAQTVSD